MVRKSVSVWIYITTCLAGIAFWMTWQLTPDSQLNTGPKLPPKIGQYVEWDKFSKQGVHFVGQNCREISIEVTLKTKSDDANLEFSFEYDQ